MPNPRQILSIAKTDSTEAHARIDRVAGMDPGGAGWTMTQADAVAAAEAGIWRFYASVWGRASWVVVATTATGEKYLKTEFDGVQPHNLLTLPTFS